MTTCSLLTLKAVYPDFRSLPHQLVVAVLPSGVATKASSGITVTMHVCDSGEYFLVITYPWPDLVDLDDGAQLLSALKSTAIKLKIMKWLDKKSLAEQARAEKEFEATWVMLGMALKQEIIRMRNSSNSAVMQSQTCVKMDFPVERLTQDCWVLIGDPDTGVRLLVVDLEQATENEEYKQASFQRDVVMIGKDTDSKPPAV